MLRIEIGRAADKAIDKLPGKHQRQISAKIQALQIDPEPPDSIQLKGKAAEWRRADSGEYRIIYRVEQNSLKVEAVGPRNDEKVYRDFLRKL